VRSPDDDDDAARAVGAGSGIEGEGSEESIVGNETAVLESVELDFSDVSGVDRGVSWVVENHLDAGGCVDEGKATAASRLAPQLGCQTKVSIFLSLSATPYPFREYGILGRVASAYWQGDNANVRRYENRDWARERVVVHASLRSVRFVPTTSPRRSSPTSAALQRSLSL
jgi:hypothetical protein